MAAYVQTVEHIPFPEIPLTGMAPADTLTHIHRKVYCGTVHQNKTLS